VILQFGYYRESSDSSQIGAVTESNAHQRQSVWATASLFKSAIALVSKASLPSFTYSLPFGFHGPSGRILGLSPDPSSFEPANRYRVKQRAEVAEREEIKDCACVPISLGSPLSRHCHRLLLDSLLLTSASASTRFLWPPGQDFRRLESRI